MEPALLAIRTLTKRFGGQPVLSDVSLDIAEGEFVCLLGPSGCGKTTLLRCVAGFLTPELGTIRIAGADVTHLPPHRRPLNTVFQNYALFPHMDVTANVAYGPRRAGASRRDSTERAAEALELVGLSGLGQRRPRELSGGQQQRVALARAIVNRPKLLLLDEPLSALDLKLRKRVQIELKHLQQKLGIAFVFVTHDQDEAMTVADRIVVMNAGAIEQVGPGPDIYRAPLTRFVADFIGEANFITLVARPDGDFDPAIGSQPIRRGTLPPGRSAVGVLRPEQVRIEALASEAGPSAAHGTVGDVIHVGSHVLIRVRVGEASITARTDAEHARVLHPGQAVAVGYRPGDVHVIGEGA